MKLNKYDFKFSVIICVYINDDANHFDDAIKSILFQTLVPNEIVILVDGPITKSLESIINKYENNSIFKIIKLEKNVGHGNARRIALENCSYELVALMDADDISVRDRFEKQIEQFNINPTVSIIGGHIYEFINDISDIIGIREVALDHKDIIYDLKKRCPMNQVTVMFKKSVINDAGGYIDWHHEEDYYLWIRCYLNGATFLNINENLVFVRVGKDMYKRRGGIKYFRSEYKLQKYMYKNKLISFTRLIYNSLLRFIVQVLSPNWFRSLIFKKYARKK